MNQLLSFLAMLVITSGSIFAQSTSPVAKGTSTAENRKPDLTIPKARGGKSGPIIFTPDGRALATCDGKGNIRFWHAQTGELVQTLPNEANVLKFAFKPGGKLIAVLANAKIAVWDLTSGTQLTQTHAFAIENPRKIVIRPGASPEFAVPTPDRAHFELWNYERGEKVKSFTPAQSVWNVRFSPDGTKLLAHTHETESGHEPTNDSVEVFEIDSGKSLGITNFRTMGSITPTNDAFLSGADGRVTLYPYDKSLPTRAYSIAAKNEDYAAIGINARGDIIAAGTLGGPIHVWNASTALHLATLEGHNEVITELGFESHDRMLASGDREGVVSFWSLR